MARTSALCTRRSTRETTQAAFGKPSRHSANGLLVRAVVLVTAADEFEQQVGMAIGIGEISDLVDHQKTGAGIVTQASAQGRIAVERGEVAKQLTGAGGQHGVTVDEWLIGDIASER